MHPTANPSALQGKTLTQPSRDFSQNRGRAVGMSLCSVVPEFVGFFFAPRPTRPRPLRSTAESEKLHG